MNLTTLGVRTARRGNTRVGRFINHWWRRRLTVTTRERIASKSTNAGANGIVVADTTLGLLAANIRTGIHALAVHTGLVSRTFGATGAFRTTGRRAANKLGQARANGLFVDLPTLGVGAAWGRLTRIYVNRNRWFVDYDATHAVWVAVVACQAVTSSQVVNHLALGVLATGSGARIAAFLVHTRQIRRAVGVQNTLGTTAIVGISEVIRQTLTRSCTTALFALGIYATRAGVAWLQNFNGGIPNGTALTKRIPSEAAVAQAHGSVTENTAVGILTTESWARIRAFLIDARLIGGTLRVGNALGPAVWWSTYEFCQAGA